MIVEKVHVSMGTVHNIIKNKLKYRKTCARWVQKELTRLPMETRLRVCTELQKRYAREGEHFHNKILTCDETWDHYYEPESKRQSTERKHNSSPVRKNSKP
uniref:Mariner Mos1 transposase n=1 Tax=Cuerna arida TaxID=1464854 RepID=A0A1B6FRT4_9HEMI